MASKTSTRPTKRMYDRSDYIRTFPKTIQESIKRRIANKFKGEYIVGRFEGEWIEGDWDRLSPKHKKMILNDALDNKLSDVNLDYRTQMAIVKKANEE